MNAFEHLNSSQISGYHSGNLAAGESREVGRHLLRCAVCRGRLPLPALDEFWTAVNTEHDGTESSSPLRQPFYRPYVEVLGNYRRLAWGSMAFLVLLSISLFILLGISRQDTGEREIAKSFETENPPITIGREDVRELGVPSPVPPKGSDNQNSPTEQKPNAPDKPLKKQITATLSGNTSRNLAISRTRGADSKCGAETALEMELGSIGNSLLLKWKKFPNAAKYHLYVSDDDEILIDEFETTTDTSYVLNKPLDPNKSYRWKIIITLENGQSISADSRTFTSKDFQSLQNPSVTKRKTMTRCTENH